MLDRFEFLLGEALVALRRNGMMTISSVTTTAIALFIFGGLGYVYLSLLTHLDTLQSEFELRFSVVPDLNAGELHAMAEDLRKIKGVDVVTFLPKDVEWRKFVEKMDEPEIYAGMENPLPDGFRIILTDLREAEAVKDEIARHKYFDPEEKIREAKDERRRYLSLMDFVRVVGFILTLLTFGTAGTLVYNAVRLTITARKTEIGTMRLVGASHGTIRWPFLLEGGLQGLAGGLLGSLLLWGVAAWAASRVSELEGFAQTGYLPYPALSMTMVLALLGAGLGMLSAGLSVRKYLRSPR